MSGHATDDFPLLLTKFETLISIAKNVPVTEENGWKANGQLLLVKTWCHFRSVATLGQFQVNRDSAKKDHVYVDHSSIAVLSRAAYETYVLFHFIFMEKDPDVRNFRHQVWRFSGLTSRLKLNRPKALPEHYVKQIEAEEQQASKLKTAILSNPLFSQLEDGTKRNVKKGDGVRLGEALIDLAVKAGLPRLYAADMYTHFCNYSHASSVSVFQIRDSLIDGNSSVMARGTIGFCCILITQIILAYGEFFEEIAEAISSDVELSDLLKLWEGIGERFKGIY
jgi:hypothetical protein